jgi:hypothetical protein
MRVEPGFVNVVRYVSLEFTANVHDIKAEN